MLHLERGRTLFYSAGRRYICSTPKLDFKFKLSDEMVKEFHEKQKAAPKERQPPKAEHTLKSSLIMGRVSHDKHNQVIKVGVPKHRLNPLLLLYVRELDDVLAYDEKSECQPGDWILLRRQEEPIDEDVIHKVERVVYSYGNWIDPLTGRRSLGLYHDDDYEKLEKIKLE